MSGPVQKATLGGGCFWCLEAVYQELRGVSEVVSGYTGGHVDNPSYEQVCSGATGHAEVVQVSYDPTVVTYRDLVRVFFTIHDPTTLNRQGADVGTQYRSAIYYHSDSQREIALAVIAEVEEQGVWSGRIVTELAPLETFWQAEAYHKDYYLRNRNQPYCRIVIDPKVAKLRKEHLELLST